MTTLIVIAWVGWGLLGAMVGKRKGLGVGTGLAFGMLLGPIGVILLVLARK